MCHTYKIVYFGCLSKDEKLPSCTPELHQIREYVNADGWHLCEDSKNEEPCGTARTETFTFVEPYCSDACEKFFEGVYAIQGHRDRLCYADDLMYEGYFPVHGCFGHLRVDYERVVLLYK